MIDALDEFEEYDRKLNDPKGQPICAICCEPIWDAKYIEYDWKQCHCDDDCAEQFFKEYMIKDFTYSK